MKFNDTMVSDYFTDDAISITIDGSKYSYDLTWSVTPATPEPLIEYAPLNMIKSDSFFVELTVLSEVMGDEIIQL